MTAQTRESAQPRFRCSFRSSSSSFYSVSLSHSHSDWNFISLSINREPASQEAKYSAANTLLIHDTHTGSIWIQFQILEGKFHLRNVNFSFEILEIIFLSKSVPFNEKHWEILLTKQFDWNIEISAEHLEILRFYDENYFSLTFNDFRWVRFCGSYFSLSWLCQN